MYRIRSICKDYMDKMITSFLQHPLDLQPMFIAKVVAQTRFFWNGQNQNGKKEMVSFEATGLNIIREHCGMVSNLKDNHGIYFTSISSPDFKS